MILSDTHRYLFVELPHTGSTAIAQELCTHYAGRPILRKHARYHEFLAAALPHQRRYFVFSGLRNPLDEAVTYYFRYRTDHRGRYSNPAKWKRNGGSVSAHSLAQYLFIQEHNADFSTWLRQFHRKPYDNWSALAHHRMDYLIRFERLQEDFFEVLLRLGLEPVRSLPMRNVTGERRAEFWEYYAPDLRLSAARIFGPFMLHWGYALPKAWGSIPVPWMSLLHFHLLRPVRRVRWRFYGHRLFD